jgi:hypothetical protein
MTARGRYLRLPAARERVSPGTALAVIIVCSLGTWGILNLLAEIGAAVWGLIG